VGSHGASARHPNQRGLRAPALKGLRLIHRQIAPTRPRWPSASATALPYAYRIALHAVTAASSTSSTGYGKSGRSIPAADNASRRADVPVAVRFAASGRPTNSRNETSGEPRRSARRQLPAAQFRKCDVSSRSSGCLASAIHARHRSPSPPHTSERPRRIAGKVAKTLDSRSPTNSRAARSGSRPGVCGRPIGMSTPIAATLGHPATRTSALAKRASAKRPSLKATASHFLWQASRPTTSTLAMLRRRNGHWAASRPRLSASGRGGGRGMPAGSPPAGMTSAYVPGFMPTAVPLLKPIARRVAQLTQRRTQQMGVQESRSGSCCETRIARACAGEWSVSKQSAPSSAPGPIPISGSVDRGRAPLAHLKVSSRKRSQPLLFVNSSSP
jgi:hypothetical protein